MDPVLVRLLIAVLVWFLGDIVVNELVADAKANRVFHVVLLVIVICYVLLGRFLPF